MSVRIKTGTSKRKTYLHIKPMFCVATRVGSKFKQCLCCLNIVLHKTYITRDRLLNSRRNAAGIFDAGISIIQMSSNKRKNGISENVHVT